MCRIGDGRRRLGLEGGVENCPSTTVPHVTLCDVPHPTDRRSFLISQAFSSPALPADDPRERLSRALRGSLDPDAFEAFRVVHLPE